MKNVVFWKLYHVSKNAGTFLRITYIQTISISKKTNENQASRLGVESRIVKKVLFPKTLNQCHMTKICTGKMCNRYHTKLCTTCWKEILNIFIPDEYIAIWYECCFRWAVPLRAYTYTYCLSRDVNVHVYFHMFVWVFLYVYAYAPPA